MENSWLHNRNSCICIYGTYHSDKFIYINRYQQISSPYHPNGVKVSFLLQENIITSSNIPLLRILDALRLIKEIPATSPDECVTNICKAIEVLSQEEKQELAELSLAYTPYVRALLGAIYEIWSLIHRLSVVH